MRLHEEIPPELEFSLTQHRVTPGELTRALATIEARKQETVRRQQVEQEAEQAYLQKTISVDEAVRELNLEATPEEIWTEVEAQRAAASRDGDVPGEDEGIGTSGSVLTDLSLPHNQVASAPISSRRWQWSRWQIAGVLLATSAIGLITFSHHHNALRPPVVTASANHATAAPYTISNFPDNIPFEQSGAGLQKILRGKDTSKIAVYPNSLNDTNPRRDCWRLIKYDGHVYLRGWIPAPPAKDALPGHIIDMDNFEWVPENGGRPAEVTLRLDTLKYHSFYERMSTLEAASYVPDVFQEMDQKITVSDVHLDQHTWERAGHVMSTQESLIPAQMIQHVMESQRVPGRPNPRLMQYAGGTSVASYPDEKMFVLSYEALSYVLTGAPLNTVDAAFNQPDLNHPAYLSGWFAVKHHGDLYLRGWIAGDLSQKDLTGPFLHLYNSPAPSELGGAAKPISLRLGSIQYGPSGRFYEKSGIEGPSEKPFDMDFVEQVILSNVHPDDHAWEKW